MNDQTNDIAHSKSLRDFIIKQSPLFLLIAGTIIISVSVLVIIGWLFNIPVLTSLTPAWISMKLNAAICFLLSGILILLSGDKNPGILKKSITAMASIIILLISSMTLLQFIYTLDLRIDQLFVKEHPLSPGTIYPGRMALLSAVNFLMISITFLYTLKKSSSGWIIQSIAWLIFLISLFCFYNYINVVDVSYALESYTTMALHTVFLFMLIAICILLIKPETGIVDIILRDDTSGYLLRFILPVILFVPMLLNFLIDLLEKKNLITYTFTHTIHAAGTFAITGILIAILAQLIHLKHKRLELSETKNYENDVIIHAFTENIDIVFFMMKPDFSKILYASPAYEKIWGKSIKSLSDNPLDWFESIFPDDKKIIENEFFNKMAQGDENTISTSEFRIIRPDGSLCYVFGRAFKLKNKKNEVFALAGIVIDITKEKIEKIHTEIIHDVSRMLESEKTIGESAPNIIKLLCKTFVWSLGEIWIIDESVNALRCIGIWHENIDATDYIDETGKFTFKFGQGFPGKIWKEEQPIWVSDYAISGKFQRSKVAEEAGFNNALGIPIKFQDHFFGILLFLGFHIEKPSEEMLHLMNTLGSLIGQFIHLTYSTKQIQSLSQHDILTGFLNRSTLEEELNKLILTTKPETILVIIVDIDGFKMVNEALGYDKGDLILQLIAKRLEATVNFTNTVVARLGADKFILYTHSLTKSGDILNYIQLIEKCFHKQFNINQNEIFLKASLGVSVYPKDGADSKSLISNADLAMRRAKNEGGNKSIFFTREMPAVAFDKLALYTELVQAMTKNQFYLVYQPQIKLENQTLCGLEALVRWQHPTKGIVAPSDFIPFAEQAGLIVSLNEHIMRMVFEEISSDWQGPPISINISAQQFKDKYHFVDYIASLKKTFNINPKNIEFEITEGIVLDDMKNNLNVLNEIQRLGFKISIDDFGTGYSSFSYLHHLPAYKIKIDISFIRGLPTHEVNALIVKSMIVMLHALGKVVLAEGAETEAEIAFLKQEKCDMVQGYYYDKPMLLEEIIKKYMPQ